MSADAHAGDTRRVSVYESGPTAFTAPSAMLEPATLRAGRMLDLTVIPASPGAIALVTTLTALIADWEGRGNKRGATGRAKLHAAVGAVVGGGLHHWSADRPRPVFHSRKPPAFTGAAVGQRQFVTTVDGLTALGLVHRAEAKQFATDYGFDFGAVSTGLVARYWPAGLLLALAVEHGVTAGTARTDFVANPAAASTVAPVVNTPLILRPLRQPRRRGQAKPVVMALRISPIDIEAETLSAGVRVQNEFAAQFDVRGCLPPRWHRTFVATWCLGGRWTAAGAQTYQSMSKANRLCVTIAGEAVTEVDVRASHLTILHGLFGAALGPDDPYAFAGIPRDTAKTWIMRTLGKGSRLTTWTKQDLASLTAIPARDIAAAVIGRFPFMAEPSHVVESLASIGPPRSLLTHRLMAIEAQALTTAMGELREAGILALPVHDAMLVPASVSAVARAALVRGFQHHAGITPVVTVNGTVWTA